MKKLLNLAGKKLLPYAIAIITICMLFVLNDGRINDGFMFAAYIMCGVIAGAAVKGGLKNA